ncbi:hypothetical protein [Prosthecomicrobium sp. N25]|uniref:hypothetical protein n=1 Tax=Prosthecomicrobium sp. N25 TaxID=3129254 RepID=UPI0030778944
MNRPAISRRTLLAGLSTLPLVAAGGASAGPLRIRGIEVDTRPLAAKGVPRYAALTREVALPYARAAFGGDVVNDRSAPLLVIEISSIQMIAYAGGSRARDDDYSQDTIVGAAVLVGPGGQVLARRPLHATRDPAAGGAWFQVEESERRRLANLCESLVYWLRREF